MKHTVTVYLLVVFTMLVHCAQAQRPTTQEADAPIETESEEILRPVVAPWTDDELPDAEAVIDQNMLAIGGYEVVDSRQMTHCVLELVAPASKAYVFESWNGGNRFYSHFQSHDGRSWSRGAISDGTLNADGSRFGFVWEQYNGNVREMKGDQKQQYLRNRTKVDSEEAAEIRFKSATCVGKAMVNDRETFQVDFVDHDDKEYSRFYDTQTWYCLRREGDEEWRSRKGNVIRDYFDFEWNGEMAFANRMEIKFDDEVYEYRTEVYEINVQPPEGIFKIPDEIEAKVSRALEANKAKSSQADEGAIEPKKK